MAGAAAQTPRARELFEVVRSTALWLSQLALHGQRQHAAIDGTSVARL
jgi:hypothetical protein